MGIDVNRTISLTFLIAGGLAGAAGLVVALYYGQTFFQYGLQFGLLSFTAAVMGGIGNLTGATLGGMFVGIVAAMSDRFIEAAMDERHRLLAARPRPHLPARRGSSPSRRRSARDMTEAVRAPRRSIRTRSPGWRSAAGRPSSSRSSSSSRRLSALYTASLRCRSWPSRGRGPRSSSSAHVRDPRARAEHRRRLRRPARPRLCRLLRDRRVHDGIPRLEPFRHPHQLVARGSGSPSSLAAIFGRDPRRADAQAARRLPRHRDARLRRDRAGWSSATSTTSRSATAGVPGRRRSSSARMRT